MTWVFGFRLSQQRLQQRCQAALRSHLKACLGKDLLPSFCGFERTQFLVGSWTESLLSAVWQRPLLPLESLHRAAHSIAASFIKASKEEFASKAEISLMKHNCGCGMLYYSGQKQVTGSTQAQDTGLGRVWIPGTRGNWGPS